MAECEDLGELGSSEDEDDLKETFLEAASWVQSKAASNSLNAEQLLYFYARFKQAHVGPCCVPKPRFYDIKGKEKWDAWNKLGDMNQEDAMKQYIESVKTIDISWDSKETKESKTKSLGPVVSTLRDPDDVIIQDGEKTAFDWVKDGSLENIQKILKLNPSVVKETDDQGMSLLHWACDRGHEGIVKELLKLEADKNLQDVDGQTPLHYASSCGHVPVIKLLISHGADAGIPDNDGELPQSLAFSDEVAKCFPT